MNFDLKLAILLHATVATVALAQSGFLHGTVVGLNGAIVPGVDIKVISSDGACDVTSNAAGKFNCQLPPGFYTLRAKQFNIVPYQRATIRIFPGSHKYIFLRPVWVAPSDQPLIKNPELRYRSQALADNMEVMAQFASEEVLGSGYVFRGEHSALTFDDVAVYSEEITCSKPIRTCSAMGAVTVEVGSEQIEGLSVEINFSTRTVVVTRNPKLIREF